MATRRGVAAAIAIDTASSKKNTSHEIRQHTRTGTRTRFSRRISFTDTGPHPLPFQPQVFWREPKLSHDVSTVPESDTTKGIFRHVLSASPHSGFPASQARSGKMS